jgi:PIN domain
LLVRAACGYLRLWIPEVVILETARHYQHAVDKPLSEIQQATQSLRRISGAAASELPDIQEFITSAEQTVSSYILRLRSTLERAGADFLSMPRISHQDLITRALAERKPFRTKGAEGKNKGSDGYRDALMWASVAEAAAHLDDGDTLILVTGNSGDFCSKANPDTLHQDLIDDLPTLAVGWYPSIESMIKALPEPPGTTEYTSQWLDLALGDSAQSGAAGSQAAPRPALSPPRLQPLLRDAVIEACEDLVGTEIDNPYFDDIYGTGREFADVDLPLETATLQWLAPHSDTISWSPYESLDKDLARAQVAVDAQVTFEGFMSKFDYYADESGVELYDGDWNDHYVWAYVERMVRLTFNAEIDIKTDEISLIFDSGSAITPGEA